MAAGRAAGGIQRGENAVTAASPARGFVVFKRRGRWVRFNREFSQLAKLEPEFNPIATTLNTLRNKISRWPLTLFYSRTNVEIKLDFVLLSY